MCARMLYWCIMLWAIMPWATVLPWASFCQVQYYKIYDKPQWTQVLGTSFNNGTVITSIVSFLKGHRDMDGWNAFCKCRLDVWQRWSFAVVTHRFSGCHGPNVYGGHHQLSSQHNIQGSWLGELFLICSDLNVLLKPEDNPAVIRLWSSAVLAHRGAWSTRRYYSTNSNQTPMLNFSLLWGVGGLFKCVQRSWFEPVENTPWKLIKKWEVQQ